MGGVRIDPDIGLGGLHDRRGGAHLCFCICSLALYLSSFVHFSRSLAGLSLAGRREQRRKKKSEGLDSKTEGVVREGDSEGREQGRLVELRGREGRGSEKKV